MINVSWDDAVEYTGWLSGETGEGYRVPSETEREYAARAGPTADYSWGDGTGHNRANCDGRGIRWNDDETAPVGSFGVSTRGLHDMHGNARAWVRDCAGRETTEARQRMAPLGRIKVVPGVCSGAAPGVPVLAPYALPNATTRTPRDQATSSDSVWHGQLLRESHRRKTTA